MNILILQLKKVEVAYTRTLSIPGFLPALGLGACALILAYTLNYYAGMHATANATNPVGDLLLDAFPRLPTDWVHNHAASWLKVFVLISLSFFPLRIPFALFSLSLLIVVRSVFINLTHLGIYPDAVFPTGSLITFGGDLFFSGHTAIPILYALIFWDRKWLRLAFIAVALFLGASSLLGHYHYSIDVFAAPFIAYGVFHIATRLFNTLWSWVLGDVSSHEGGRAK